MSVKMIQMADDRSSNINVPRGEMTRDQQLYSSFEVVIKTPTTCRRYNLTQNVILVSPSPLAAARTRT